MDSLKVMNKAGASIGPDSNVPTFPVELLRYLEGEQNNTICNPDLFQGKLLEECEKSAVEVAQKIERLQVILFKNVILDYDCLHRNILDDQQ